MLTAKQRYWQAVEKARMMSRRELRQFTADAIEVLPCSGDREREFIIAEMEKMQAEIDRLRHAM